MTWQAPNRLGVAVVVTVASALLCAAPAAAHPTSSPAVRELDAIRLAIRDFVRQNDGRPPANWSAIWKKADAVYFQRRAPKRPPLHDGWRFVHPDDRGALGDGQVLVVSHVAVDFGHDHHHHAGTPHGQAEQRWGLVVLDDRGRPVVRSIEAGDTAAARRVRALRRLEPDLTPDQRAATRRTGR